MTRNSDKRIEEILDEAEQLVIRQGFRRFNLDQLARQLRMSKRTIYAYYPSKEELFFAALNRRASRLIQRLKEINGMQISARDKLYLASECVVLDLSELDNSLIGDLKQFFPDFFLLSQGYFRQVAKYIASILEEGARNGEFRTDVNPALLTRLFQGIGDYLCDPDFLMRNRLSVEKVYSGTMQLLMEGILNKSERMMENVDSEFHKSKGGEGKGTRIKTGVLVSQRQSH
jgi:AcrR family transcriptional regulator